MLAIQSQLIGALILAVPRLIVYHAGTLRVLFLGALKITTVFVFGFFAVVTIPSYVQVDAPVWLTASLVVASVIPMLAVWYMTSPMVMWMHISIPRACVNHPKSLENFIEFIPPNTELTITTMGLLGKARISKLPLKDLHREERRLGLVNHVRDATRENAARRWYQFRAVSQFKIEERSAHHHSKTEAPWLWYSKGIQKVVKERAGEPADRRNPDDRIADLQKFVAGRAANSTQRRDAHPHNPSRPGSSPSQNKGSNRFH